MVNISFPVTSVSSLREEIKLKLANQSYSLGDFNALTRHFDVLETAINELIITFPERAVDIMSYVFTRCSDQVYHDYWDKGIPARVGHMLANIVNTNPQVDWRSVRDAARTKSAQSKSLDNHILKPLLIKSIHSYGKTLQGIFPSYNIAEALGSICSSKDYFEPNREKTLDNKWRTSMGLAPEHEEQLDWSTPDAKKNLSTVIIKSLSVTDPNCDFLAFTLKELNTDQLELGSLMDTLREHSHNNWSTYSPEEQSKILFIDFMLFNALARLTDVDLAGRDLIATQTIKKYIQFINIPDELKSEKRTQFINNLYRDLIPEEQLNYIHAYLNLTDPSWIDIKLVNRLYSESQVSLCTTTAVETPSF